MRCAPSGLQAGVTGLFGGRFDDLDGEFGGLLNEEDILIMADLVQPNSSAAVMVFENVWATRLRDAIAGAGGRLVDNARIPAAVVDAAIAAM